MHLQQLDDACRAHMHHGAMPVGDALTESLYMQLEGPAAEGGQPHGPAPAPLTEQQQRQLQQLDSMGDWLLWLVAGIAVAALTAHLLAFVFSALAHHGA